MATVRVVLCIVREHFGRVLVYTEMLHANTYTQRTARVARERNAQKVIIMCFARALGGNHHQRNACAYATLKQRTNGVIWIHGIITRT